MDGTFQIHITIFCVGRLTDMLETQVIFNRITRKEYILRNCKENQLKRWNLNWLVRYNI